MQNFKKAEILYLRGFCGEYIKRRTGVSVQSLLKTLKSNGVTYTKHDIEAYQELYIRGRYTCEDVEAAYWMISKKYADLDKASRGRHIECLGCGFGSYRKLFEKILGKERYAELRSVSGHTHLERSKQDTPRKTRQQAMCERYGIAERALDIQSNTPKDALYVLLVNQFGEEDVCRNLIVDKRYPYHVDFYVKSRDLFIELNGDKSHNTHWFDESDFRDRQTLDSWHENMLRIERETGKKSRYRQYIKTWTQTDVAKRTRARDMGLNYLVFWDGGNKNSVPSLIDARAWFLDGCPEPKDWHPENTY